MLLEYSPSNHEERGNKLRLVKKSGFYHCTCWPEEDRAAGFERRQRISLDQTLHLNICAIFTSEYASSGQSFSNLCYVHQLEHLRETGHVALVEQC